MKGAKTIGILKLPILFLIAWGILHNPIEASITKYLVTPFLSSITTKEEPSIVISLIAFLLIEAYCLIRAFCRKKEIPFSLIIWGYVIVLLYIVYRFWGSVWKFTPFFESHPGEIAILDPIMALGFINLLIYTCPVKRSGVVIEKGRGFLSDTATKISAQDDPDRRYQFTESLVDRILNTQNDEGSLAIAVVGKWGTGKTTFLQSIENRFTEKKANVHQFTFNPWLIENDGNVTKTFFTELSDELSIYHSSIQSDLSEYVGRLITDKDNWLYAAIGFFKKAFGIRTLSIGDIKDNVNGILRKLQKKIIIYIDDLDRLDGKEITNVIRIIRNSGDFANVIFIVALDKSRVVQSLESDFGNASSSYLEKVFQLEFYLPPLRPLNLLQTLNDKLIAYLDEEDRKILEEMFIERSHELSFNWVTNLVQHYRDVKRYINIFVVQYGHLRREVYFPDLYVLTFLRLKYPEVYYFIYTKKSKIFTDTFISEGPYQLEVSEDGKTLLQGLLELQQYQLHLATDDITEIVSIVNHLFPDAATPGSWDYQEKQISNTHLRINQGNYFERYFDLHFFGRLSQVEFDKAFNKPMKEWFDYIESKKPDLTILEEVLEFLKWKDFYYDKNDFIKTVEGILRVYETGVRFDKSVIKEKLEPSTLHFDLRHSKRVYPLHELFGSKSNFVNYLMSMFDEYARPGSGFLEYLYVKAEENGELPVSSEQIIDILSKVFDKALQISDIFTMDIFMLYAHLIPLVKSEPYPTDKIKNFIINKDIDGFIQAAIQISPFKDDGHYWIAPFVEEIFSSVDNLIASSEFQSQVTSQRKALIDLNEKLKQSNKQGTKFDLDQYYSSQR